MAITDYTKQNISEFDANLDSHIQLNSSKVKALDGTYSLVISSGGTGADALLETKGLINKTCCKDVNHKDLPTNHVVYIAFDTDEKTLGKVSSKTMGGARLSDTDGEFVQMKAPKNTYLQEEYRELVPQYISSWLDFSIDKTHRGQSGAGGIRQCGRLLMFENIERICTAVRSAINKLVAGQKVKELNIYLLAGIAGGTGSGTFLDLAYIARQVAEEIKSNAVTMYGYLFLPDVNLSRAMPPDNVMYTKKNGYAALKELDYLMNMSKEGGRFIQQYSENFLVDTERAPFDFVHLISSKGSEEFVPEEPYKQCMGAVAQSIVSFVAEERKEGVATVFAMDSHYDNIAQAVRQHKRKFNERYNNYIALGTYSYEIPIDKILLYVTSLLFEKMNHMFVCDPMQRDIDIAYTTIGLMPNALLAGLLGNHASIAPYDTNWEDLFGQSPKYNLTALCENWINRTTIDVQERADVLVRDFPERFKNSAHAWFTDPERGPIWVNHALINNSRDSHGIIAMMQNDYNKASSQITSFKTECEKMRQMLKAKAQEAKRIKKKRRPEVTAEYIDLVNQYADMNVRMVALGKMKDIYTSCREVIIEQNNKFFDVIVEVLEGLKDVCQKNADILTKTKRAEEGRHFTWQPLRIPDVSNVIKRAFDQKGNADQTITNFCQAIYNKAAEWSSGNVDVKTFIRDYLDENLSDIANNSLEEYIKEALKGEDLQKSVIQTLAPNMTQGSEPLMALSNSADKGGTYSLLSVPYSCTGIYNAFKTYRESEPDIAESLTIQLSGISSRVFEQSMLSSIPLYSYAPLADYEKAYLSINGDEGKHLYMGKDEDWRELPTPIPYRSRPKMAGAYPPEIKRMEDALRELYEKCRELPIIRRSDGETQTFYDLHIAKLPGDLDERFGKEKMRDEKGRLDIDRIRNAHDTLESWLKDGLPDRDLGEGVHVASYNVAKCLVPRDSEPDKRDEEARECFIGQYNNVRRAREELKKYAVIKDKYEKIKELYDTVNEVPVRAAKVGWLLISRVVQRAENEDGEMYYKYVSGGRARKLIDVEDCADWRESALADIVEALEKSDDVMQRSLGNDLVNQAKTEFERMNKDIDDLKEKSRRLYGLLGGVSERYVRLKDDLTAKLADERVNIETVSFYETLCNVLKKEAHTVDRKISRREDAGAEF